MCREAQGKPMALSLYGNYVSEVNGYYERRKTPPGFYDRLQRGVRSNPLGIRQPYYLEWKPR